MGNDSALNKFMALAEERDDIRAAILTSSRVQSDRKPDALSDYDIALYVSDISAFKKNDDWLSPLGDPAIYWPRLPQSTSLESIEITRLVIFNDHTRFDFQISLSSIPIASDAYSDGYQVLLDKDGITNTLDAERSNFYHTAQPTAEEYSELVNDFLWDATYVPKHLRRDEMPAAKYMFSHLHQYLIKMATWYIGAKNNWDVSTGINGKWLKKYLSPADWGAFEQTYTGADIHDNWEAFHKTVDLFEKFALSLSQDAAYEFPSKKFTEAKAYYDHVQTVTL
jgi:aminoglycoside 6-adenylyltransferase